MARQGRQSVFWRFFRSRLFLITAGLLTVFVACSYARGYYQEYKIEQEIEALQNEVARLEKKKIESLDILDYVMSQDFVEEKARVELNMKKPGENIVVISAHDSPEHAEFFEHEPSTDEAGLNNPLKWWYYFVERGGKQ